MFQQKNQGFKGLQSTMLDFLEKEIFDFSGFDFGLFIWDADGDAGKKFQGVTVFHCICDDLRVSAEGFQK
jgi:hypothetical protein